MRKMTSERGNELIERAELHVILMNRLKFKGAWLSKSH